MTDSCVVVKETQNKLRTALRLINDDDGDDEEHSAKDAM